MLTDLTGTTALVTGATSGIGAACAEQLWNRGARVVVAGRRADRLQAVAARWGERVHPVALDVRDRGQVEKALGALPPSFAEVDVLVNSAGLALGLGPAPRASLDEWQQMIETNCLGLVAVTRALLPGMVARDRGHVVNIGSVAAHYPYPGGQVYGGTKAFVHQFTLGLRADLLGTRVRATVIEPGMVETEFSEVRFGGDAERAKKVYAGMKPMSADDVAEIVLWCLTRPAHVNVNTIEVMPVQQAFSPFAVHRG
ncbi:MAG TPA: SDR family NAD(P)-dependent oxidoreductase [Anaeromyxobacteraceae bacterium]|nr:SDR family NAD(P)-dependent oxidoreductase [Anaeromyxobacteraceae bacterium]